MNQPAVRKRIPYGMMNFICLLFYYGILTINGTQEGETLLTIPNKIARKQLYSHLISSKN